MSIKSTKRKNNSIIENILDSLSYESSGITFYVLDPTGSSVKQKYNHGYNYF